jgi:hypothetical protein
MTMAPITALPAVALSEHQAAAGRAFQTPRQRPGRLPLGGRAEHLLASPDLSAEDMLGGTARGARGIPFPGLLPARLGLPPTCDRLIMLGALKGLWTEEAKRQGMTGDECCLTCDGLRPAFTT